MFRNAFNNGALTPFSPQPTAPGIKKEDPQTATARTSSPREKDTRSTGLSGNSGGTIKGLLRKKINSKNAAGSTSPDKSSEGNQFTNRDLTMLMEATIFGNAAAVQAYVEDGANIARRGKEGTTAVDWAVICGEVEILKNFFLPKRSDLDTLAKVKLISDAQKRQQVLETQVRKMSEAGLVRERLNTLLTKLQFPVSIPPSDPVYAFESAAIEKHIVAEMVRLWKILESEEKGSKSNLSIELNNMLHKNVLLNNLEGVWTLQLLGADPNAPVQGASKSSLNAYGLGATALHAASANGLPEMVEMLLQMDANPNARDDNGNNPLHYLVPYAMKGDEAKVRHIIEILLDAGANATQKNGYGRTALADALSLNQNFMVEQLEQAGYASQERKTHRELLALRQVVTRSDNPKAIYPLLSQNPELLSARSIDGNTLLAVAIRNGRTATASYLIEEGASIVDINAEGGTILHEIASAGNNTVLLEVLKEKRSSEISYIINRTDRSGHTALHVAADSRESSQAEWNSIMIQALINAGAEVKAQDALRQSTIVKRTGMRIVDDTREIKNKKKETPALMTDFRDPEEVAAIVQEVREMQIMMEEESPASPSGQNFI